MGAVHIELSVGRPQLYACCAAAGEVRQAKAEVDVERVQGAVWAGGCAAGALSQDARGAADDC